MVAGADVDGVGVGFLFHLAGHRAGLGNLFRHQPVALQHIQKVGVAAKVQLIGVVNLGAPIFHQPRQHPVHDGCAYLRLDVVADDGHAALFKAAAPVVFPGDEHRNAVNHGAARVQNLLHVPFGRHLAAHRQVVDDHVNFPLLQDARDVSGTVGRLHHHVREVAADAVVGHAALHGHSRVRHVGELDGVVRLGENGLGQVLAHLLPVHVKGRNDFNVFNPVFPDAVVHHAGDRFVVGHFNVLVNALNQ